MKRIWLGRLYPVLLICNAVYAYIWMRESGIAGVGGTAPFSKWTYLAYCGAMLPAAILTVLLKGTPGETYNAANPETYCSIYEMGEMVAEQLAGGRICVRVDENGDASRYPAPSFLNMDIGKIQRLGWSPAHDLVWMYRRLEEYLREEMG